MSRDSFQKTNWGWQLSQLQQQVGEWLELQFSQFKSTLPELAGPGWSVELLKAMILLLLGFVLIWLCWQVWRLLEPYLI